jgi:SAM-dependent methyltransferase
MWRVRARGLDALRRALARRYGAKRLRVCERGAGAAWLSRRLARDGHDVVATDVSADARDGLGAARHFLAEGLDLRLAVAEQDRLPLADASVDVVVNAASFHYAVGRDAQERAVREAARVLAPGGALAILDSPVYGSRASGEAMLAEWRAAHPDATADSAYLVRDEILDLLRASALTPSVSSHWMGWRWTANYLRHRALGPREPARLPLIFGIRADP